jgi:hypothetical protein
MSMGSMKPEQFIDLPREPRAPRLREQIIISELEAELAEVEAVGLGVHADEMIDAFWAGQLGSTAVASGVKIRPDVFVLNFHR